MERKTKPFDWLNAALLGMVCLVTLYPFWYVLVGSLSSAERYYADPYHIFPTSISFDAYRYVLSSPKVMRSVALSALVTVLGTAGSLWVTLMAGYFLSKKWLWGRNAVLRFLVVPMYFNGGLFPWYALITSLHMKNTIWVLILPLMVNTFHLILMRNYLSSLPDSLEESAKVDGATEWTVLFRILAPMSKSILATIALFTAVSYWNDYYLSMLFSTSEKYYSMALVLRLMIAQTMDFSQVGLTRQVPDIAKMATIVLSVVPIVAVYPFVQRYFVQGIMLGAVKE